MKYTFLYQKFLKEFKIHKDSIDFISLSGQTVYHNPLKQISIQLGSGKVIANNFKIKHLILGKMTLKIKAKAKQVHIIIDIF